MWKAKEEEEGHERVILTASKREQREEKIGENRTLERKEDWGE